MDGVTHESPLMTEEELAIDPVTSNALGHDRTDGWPTATLLKTLPRT